MKPNLNEKLLCISGFVGVFHAIRCIDPSGYAGRLQIKNLHTLATGFCVAGPIHVGLMLVTSWITIIDGGKKKRAPRWARVLYNLGVWSSYASELGLGLLEYRMPALNDSGALDGAITGVKYLVSVLWCVVYCILCFLYGMRISNMLKGKGEINPQAKRIRKMCRLGTVGFFFGALVKVFGVFGREFKICQTVTPCDPIIELMIPIFVYFLQYLIAYTCQPARKGKKAITRLAEAAIGKKLFESTASSTEVGSAASTVVSRGDGDGNGDGEGGNKVHPAPA